MQMWLYHNNSTSGIFKLLKIIASSLKEQAVIIENSVKKFNILADTFKL